MAAPSLFLFLLTLGMPISHGTFKRYGLDQAAARSFGAENGDRCNNNHGEKPGRETEVPVPSSVQLWGLEFGHWRNICSTREIPPPNGETFFGRPSGRVCDGRLIVDFMVERLKLPYLSAYLDSVGTNFRRGANFATGGSSIRPGGYSPFHLGVQISQFKQFKARTSRIGNMGNLPRAAEFPKALYTFDIGLNELGYCFQHSSEEDVWKSIPDILSQLADAVKQGARFFWVHNTGPYGCLPTVVYNSDHEKLDRNGCVISRNNVAQEFNRRLEHVVSQLTTELPHSAFTLVDVYSAKYQLISTASDQGFVDPMTLCCGSFSGYNVTCRKDPSTHVSWDGIHYSEAANMRVAHRVLDGSLSRPPVSVEDACRRHV